MKFLFIVIVVFMTNSAYRFNDRHGRSLTHDEVANLLHHPETERFLMGFNSSYQRWILTKQLEHCPYTPLCSFSFNIRPMSLKRSCCTNCACDFPQCIQKKTCCPDIIFRNIALLNDSTMAVDDIMLMTVKGTHKTCLPLYLSNNDVIETKQSAFGYDTCPLQTSKHLVQNCTREYTTDVDSFADILPVKSKASNELYRNKYCAYCHNITDENFQAFENRLICKSVTRLGSEKSIINEVLSKSVCEIEFVSEKMIDRCLTAVTKCNTTGLWTTSNSLVESACALYRSVIGKNKGFRRFQNVFCSECNGIVQPDLQCDIQPATEGGIDFAFSGLLKLDRQDAIYSDDPSTDSCSDNKIYDKISETCKELHCPINMDLSRGKCVDIFEQLDSMLYSTFIRITPIRKVNLNESSTYSDLVIQYTRSWFSLFGEICNIQMFFQTAIGYGGNYIQRTENSSFLFYDVRIQFFVDRYHDPKDFIESIIKSHNFSFFQHENLFEVRVIDSDPKLFDIISILSETTSLSDAGTHNQEELESSDVDVLIREHAFPGYKNMTAFPYLKGTKDTFCGYKKSPLNILWLRSCPKVNISKYDFPWTKTTNGLIVQPGDYILFSEEFYFADENHVMVCVDSFKELLSNAPSSSSSFSIATIISVVCSSLSITCLAITFIIFYIFPQLRQTIPGKNNMSLVLFLLAAQILYTVSSIGRLNAKSSECVILGILVHFFWLLAIFWMNICTFHVSRVLAKTRVISQGSGLKRFITYHIFAVIMAACFVSINITVSYHLTGDIGYGGRICYISSQQMVNYTFVIPTAFVVVSNISMFLFLIIKIKKISSVQKNVQNERNDLNVFAKLSTITGLTWIFGLLYTWTNMIVLSYLFIILNASQGVFIMLAFVVNRRVFNLLKTKSPGTTSTGSSRTASSAFTPNS